VVSDQQAPGLESPAPSGGRGSSLGASCGRKRRPWRWCYGTRTSCRWAAGLTPARANTDCGSVQMPSPQMTPARRDGGRECLGPGRVQAVPHEAHQAAEVGTEVKGDGHGHGQLDAGGGAGAREVACHVDGDGGGEEGDAEVEAVAGQGAQALDAQDGHVAVHQRVRGRVTRTPACRCRGTRCRRARTRTAPPRSPWPCRSPGSRTWTAATPASCTRS
jgi:hypothetical protein